YRNLFARAPVSIWEEDFTEVAAYLGGLQAEGVTDLRAHLERHPEVVRTAASKIRVRAVNDAAVELIDAESPEDLIGPLDPALLPDDALGSIVPQLLAVWNGQDHIVLEVTGGRTFAGRSLDAILSWTVPPIGDDLDLSHVIVTIVDVTAIRRAQEQLETLLRSKDEFVASVSHELRTPLTAVVGLATELRDSFVRFDHHEIREFVDVIATEAEDVSTIVDDLLAAARAEAGTLSIRAGTIDVEGEIQGVLRGMSLGAAVALTVVHDIPLASGDAARVRQIVRNLLVNAQRYGGKEIRVALEFDDASDAVVIEVRDTGGELEPPEREAIFERYYRTRQVPGITASVGLGLTVSRELAVRMGGDLVYDHDGQEAIFRLRLPAASKVPA
ncbi:MAG: ATP-binding protein, partial [Acidimicrobiia bacterium]